MTILDKHRVFGNRIEWIWTIDTSSTVSFIYVVSSSYNADCYCDEFINLFNVIINNLFIFISKP